MWKGLHWQSYSLDPIETKSQSNVLLLLGWWLRLQAFLKWPVRSLLLTPSLLFTDFHILHYRLQAIASWEVTQGYWAVVVYAIAVQAFKLQASRLTVWCVGPAGSSHWLILITRNHSGWIYTVGPTAVITRPMPQFDIWQMRGDDVDIVTEVSSVPGLTMQFFHDCSDNLFDPMVELEWCGV